MRRIYLLIAAGLLGAASLQAQTVVAELGFEDGSKDYTTEYALTPNIGNVYGDWVNKKETDEWNEKCTEEPHSGEYCFMATNTGAMGWSWDRGFKIGVPMKTETPYRVSFWAKVDPETTYSINADGSEGDERTEDTKLTSWLSKGMENYDKSILSYGLNQVTGFTGEWQHMAFVVYNPTAEAMDATIPSWQGTGEFPAKFGGSGETYREHFDAKFPEIYFFIANMFCPATYYLDDIVIEEGVTVKEVTHSDEIIKIDFGYATNIASLAKANKGTVVLDKSLVKVSLDGEEVDVVYVEGKEDGFLYVLVDAQMYDDTEVVVSFEGAEELLYSSSDRPSSDTTGNVQVFGFKNETAYWDETVETEFLAWGQPTVKTSVPVNKSFNLKPEDVKEVSMTFTSAVNMKNAKARLIKGSKKTDLTADMKLSEDGKTITMPVSGLTDGEYEVVIEGLKNADGTVTAEDAVITFEIGEPQGSADEVVVYKSDWSVAAPNVPYGCSGESDGNAEANSTPSEPFSGSGTAPRLMGSSEDLNQGIYWCARNGSKASLAFGKYAAMSGDGTKVGDGIDPEVEALWFDEGSYILTYKLAEWQRDPTPYTLGIFAADQTALESWEEPAPEAMMNAITDEVVIPATEHEFTITTPGYYYVEFAADGKGWQAWLLTSLSITSKPASSGTAALKKLKEAIETAELTIGNADEKYNGTAKDALAATIKEAQDGTFTNPQAVDDMVKKLVAAGQKFADRKTNYDNFVKNYEDAKTSLETLEGKYKTNAQVKDAEAIIKKYDGVNPTNYSDDELAAASKDVDGVPAILNNIKSVVDILTYRAAQASELGLKLGVDEEILDALDALAKDATADIDAANKHITLALYQAIADNVDLEPLKEKQYSSQIDENFDETDEESVATHDADGHLLIMSGINFTGYIKNPNFYTTKAIESIGDDTFTGWMCTQNEDGFAKQNTGASNDNSAVDAMLQSYGENVNYDLYQVISDLPVGVYTLVIGSRLATYDYDEDGDGENETYEYNGLNDETGLWDKYIYAQVGDGKVQATKFSVGGYAAPQATSVKEIKVEEGKSVRIGAVENYTSGKAHVNGKGEEVNFWDTTTFIDNARIYFTAPLEGYDYAAAAQKLAQDIETAIEAVEATPAAQTDVIYNLAGQQVDENYKGIVIKNGVKVLQK